MRPQRSLKRRQTSRPAPPAKSSSTTLSAKSTNTTSFFSLPRELRDEVYHELWKGKLAFIVIYGAYEFQIHYIETEFESEEPVQTTFRENGRKKFMSKSPWIYTNGQVLQEAIEQFQRHCTWSSNGIMPDQRSTPPTKSAIMAMYNKSKFLLSPWKARLLRLEMQQLQELYELDQAGNGRSFVSRIDLYDTGVPCLKFLHATIPAIPQLRRSNSTVPCPPTARNSTTCHQSRWTCEHGKRFMCQRREAWV